MNSRDRREREKKPKGSAASCLTPWQLEQYGLDGMLEEERHAIEVHLLSCPLCYQALAGLEKNPGARPSLSSINPEFLKEHFGWQYPQIQVNALATTTRPRRPIWTRLVPPGKTRGERPPGIPAVWTFLLVLGAGMGFYLYAGRPSWEEMRAYFYEGAPAGHEAREKQEVTANPGAPSSLAPETSPGSETEMSSAGLSAGADPGPRAPAPAKLPFVFPLGEDTTKPGSGAVTPEDSLPALRIPVPAGGDLPEGPRPASPRTPAKPDGEKKAPPPKREEKPSVSSEPPAISSSAPPAKEEKEEEKAALWQQARDYMDQGKDSQAKALLEPLLESRGRERRQARRWIREIERKEEEERQRDAEVQQEP